MNTCATVRSLWLWSGLFDVYMGIFYAPQLMFPATAICSDGFLIRTSPTLSFSIFVVLMGGTGMSIFSAFLFRLSTNYPALFTFSQQHSCFFFSWKVVPILSALFFVFALFEILLCIFVVWALRVLVMRKIEENKETMSKRTLQLHQQLNNSLSIQFLVPEFFLVVPFTLIIALILTGNHGTKLAQRAGNCLMMFSSMHSLFNAFSMILFTGPYRRACVEPFRQFTLNFVHPSSVRRGTLTELGQNGANIKVIQI
ncbi:hypothetical protein M3Y97_00645300 [Aphelenchoides bicaudatus]|nr:hypothetical protein M3Y97_00645300 [Aphelenchoides bicaudatus]